MTGAGSTHKPVMLTKEASYLDGVDCYNLTHLNKELSLRST